MLVADDTLEPFGQLRLEDVGRWCSVLRQKPGEKRTQLASAWLPLSGNANIQPEHLRHKQGLAKLASLLASL